MLLTGDGATPELYNPATGTWAVTGQMNTPRTDSTATLLSDGQVLVAGGTSDTGTFALSSAELYNPATGTWSKTGSMASASEDPMATLLNDGQVLIAGPAAELYDPATGKFGPTGGMTGAVGVETATLLPDGDVLATEKGQNFAQVYDPATGQWSDASGGMAPCQGLEECRIYSTATLLPTGDVLVAGGLVGLDQSPQTTASALLYNPGTSTWTATGSMTTGREGQTATLLPDGQVLMAGGTLYDHPSNGHPGIIEFLSSAELYTP